MKAMAPMCPALSIWAAPGCGSAELCDHPQKDAQHHIEHRPSRCMKYRNLLGTDSTHWRTGRRGRRDRSGALSPTMRRVVHEGRLPAFAGEGYKVVVPTVAAASAGKTMGKDAALKILWQTLCARRAWGVVVALAVELTRAGQL